MTTIVKPSNQPDSEKFASLLQHVLNFALRVGFEPKSGIVEASADTISTQLPVTGDTCQKEQSVSL